MTDKQTPPGGNGRGLMLTKDAQPTPQKYNTLRRTRKAGSATEPPLVVDAISKDVVVGRSTGSAFDGRVVGWTLTIEGKDVPITTHDICSQTRLRARLAEAGFRLPRMTEQGYIAFANGLLNRSDYQSTSAQIHRQRRAMCRLGLCIPTWRTGR